MAEGQVEAIFISGQRGDLPHPVECVQAVAGKGLEGNRYFDTGRPHQELTLIEAGYPLPLAEKLADSEADLHGAVELVASGCAHETAARILL